MKNDMNPIAGFLYTFIMGFILITVYAYKTYSITQSQWIKFWIVISIAFVVATFILIFGSDVWAAIKRRCKNVWKKSRGQKAESIRNSPEQVLRYRNDHTAKSSSQKSSDLQSAEKSDSA